MDDILDLDAVAQIACLRAQQVRLVDLVAATLERIKVRNPAINAIVSLRDRDAILRHAGALEGTTAPLAGLPIAIKDLAETKGLRTTFGAPGFAEYVPEADAPFVARLKAAGALVIGKTNTSEWGLGSHSYNLVHGVTRNPLDQTLSAGGSSGGAAAALRAGLVALADGSDMMGSLRNPAGWCDVWGFRPTYGLVPNASVGEAFLHPLVTIGPMGRSVRDMELLLSVMAVPDPKHPHSIGPFVSTQICPPRKIGWIGDWDGYYPMEDGVLCTARRGADRLVALGHEVVELVPDFDPVKLWESWITLRSWAVAEGQRALYAQPKHRALMKPEAVWEIERGMAFSAAQVHAASAIASDWFRWVATMPCDVLALPTAQIFAFPAEWDWPKQISGRPMDTYHRWMEVVVPASLIGLPTLAMPAGFDAKGRAMGLQLIGKRGTDAQLLALGRMAGGA